MTTLITHVILYKEKNTVFFFSGEMSIYGHHSTENLVFSLETLDYENIVT